MVKCNTVHSVTFYLFWVILGTGEAEKGKHFILYLLKLNSQLCFLGNHPPSYDVAIKNNRYFGNN